MKEIVLKEWTTNQTYRPDPIDAYDIRCEEDSVDCWFYIFR